MTHQTTEVSNLQKLTDHYEDCTKAFATVECP